MVNNHKQDNLWSKKIYISAGWIQNIVNQKKEFSKICRNFNKLENISFNNKRNILQLTKWKIL